MAIVSAALGAAGMGGGGGGALGTLFVRLAADSTQLERGMASAEKSVKLGGVAIIGALAAVSAAAVNEFMKFESSFAGVRKTVNATEEEFKQFEATFRKMALQMPVNVNEINKVAEAAGQLGIKNQNIVSFTKTMLDLGVATNLTSDQAATSLARLANITQMPQTEFDKLGSTVVALGNKLATTEAEIVAMAMRLAGAGHQVGMSEAEIVSLSAALSSVGVQAEAGGTAISTAMITMAKAVATGSEELGFFAAVSNQTSEEFKASFGKDAVGTIVRFIEGLGKASKAGRDVFTVMDRLGLDGARMTDVVLRAAGAGDLFATSIKTGTEAWKENNALTEEANKRYATLESSLTITANHFREILITIGEGMAPAVRDLNTALQEMTKANSAANESWKETGRVLGGALMLTFKSLVMIWEGWRDLIKVVAISMLAVAEMQLRQWLPAIEILEKAFGGFLKLANDGMNTLIKQVNQIILAFPEVTGSMKLLRPINFDIKTPVDSDKVKEWITTLQLARKELTDGLVKSVMGAGEAVTKEVEVIDTKFEEMATTIGGQITTIDKQVDRLKMKMDSDLMSATLKEIGKPDDSFLGNDPFMGQLSSQDKEITAIEAKLKKIEELNQKELDLTADVQKQKEAVVEAYNKRLHDLMMAQTSIVLSSYENAFGQMADAMRGFQGEQSAIYKAMFIASKAFAIADASVKIAQGVANALSLPWPANLAAVASVIAAAANIISSISSVNLALSGEKAVGGGVRGGGRYLVGERGPEVFSPASNGSIIPNKSLGGEVRVEVNNYAGAQVEVGERSDGNQRVVEVAIRRIKTEMGSEIRDGRGDLVKAMEQSYGLRRGKGGAAQ